MRLHIHRAGGRAEVATGTVGQAEREVTGCKGHCRLGQAVRVSLSAMGRQ